MGDADYTGNQLTLDGQRTGGFLDYWHLVGGPIVFFWFFFFISVKASIYLSFFSSLTFFLKILCIFSMDSNRKTPCIFRHLRPVYGVCAMYGVEGNWFWPLR